jgi:hypothetical protein
MTCHPSIKAAAKRVLSVMELERADVRRTVQWAQTLVGRETGYRDAVMDGRDARQQRHGLRRPAVGSELT